ncbi:hypothetical protein [Ulvibacterium sp.]|uniref:hypothetical protein n=1 Tax=Ulvibacterium sp. TaxID=2665914 RepID=UPI003BA8BFD9
MAGQNDNSFDIQADKVEETSNSEIQIFKKKFEKWVKSFQNDSLKPNLKVERMINNFILFSEDGLMMKDLKFHTVESCKNEIIANLPSREGKTEEKDWVYVTLESQVNKSQLIEVLSFLREKNIEYQFGQEDEFIPKMIKQ